MWAKLLLLSLVCCAARTVRAEENEMAGEDVNECTAEQCQAIVDQLPASLAAYAGCSAQCVVMVPLIGVDESNSKPAVIVAKDGDLFQAMEETAEDGEKRLRLGTKVELNDRDKRPSFIRIGKRPSFIRIGRSTVSRLLRLGKRPSFIRIGK